MSGTVAVAPGSAGAQDKQYVLINLLKAVAAQLIVLHHLAFYGPMADHARVLAPGVFDFLADDARIAVQVFLVIGGFLAAKSLSPRGLPGMAHPFQTIYRRYVKLAPPFLVAMLLAIGASALASMWMTHPSISAPPSFAQLSAHALLLHDVLGYEALSAGAWYVAIDFQLYALMTVLLWSCGRVAFSRLKSWLMPVVVMAAVSSSLFVFNRDADWDISAFYFFGSYGLGVLAWWASDTQRSSRAVTILLGMLLIPALAALAVDFRVRIALALVVACLLCMFGRASLFASRSVGTSFLRFAGNVSYSVFLVHFPICLVMNAVFARFINLQPAWQALGVAMAWATSMVVGVFFHRWVERPLGRLFVFHGKTVAVGTLALKEKM
ncbi:acyltransferase [Massilia sp. YIM B02769]|uniref:acyltransferase family protein n=1 Tax=Massilia sp. YIM B02769 TaxID=3050129 RepID=UPI0025B72E41|nr:acyltransferase [Massilia sp. YIM B02769]MDN4056625.1 acyltransferase [Massilia sp. YIM B02769]